METTITSPCKNILFKKSSKRNQNCSRYYNSVTYLKFQQKPKYHLSKILIYRNRSITLGPKSLKLLYSIMNLKHNNILLALVGNANKGNKETAQSLHLWKALGPRL
jgi:hypothetical protein